MLNILERKKGVMKRERIIYKLQNNREVIFISLMNIYDFFIYFI